MVRLYNLTVFVNGGGADNGQVAVRQFGLQHIAGAGIALPAVQQDMNLVNEQDGVVNAAQLFHDIFQTVLYLPLVGGACYERGIVKLKHTGSLQERRHLMVDYVPCKPVHKGCFPHPGITDNQHVRFAAAAQHLHDHAVLPVTVDGRVKPVCRGGGKVHAILGEKGSGRGNGTLNETFRHVAGNSRRFVACIYGMDIFLQDRERPELVTGKGDARFRQCQQHADGIDVKQPHLYPRIIGGTENGIDLLRRLDFGEPGGFRTLFDMDIRPFLQIPQILTYTYYKIP